jgi:hypothetical protein
VAIPYIAEPFRLGVKNALLIRRDKSRIETGQNSRPERPAYIAYPLR